jgi:hypothetical protein
MANRREFVQFAGLGAIGALSPKKIHAQLHLNPPLQTKVTKFEEHKLPNGSDYVWEYTLTDPAGTTLQMKGYNYSLDFGDAYSSLVTFVGLHQNQEALRFTRLVTGKKGQVSGDFRYDDQEITDINADGSVVRANKQAVAVRLTNPAEGLSADQVVALLTKYHTQHWNGGNTKNLTEVLREHGQ